MQKNCLIDMNRSEKSKKRFLRNDIILIAVLFLFAAVGGVYLFFFREAGSTVTVTIDGEAYGVYSLSEDITEDIFTGENNEQFNRLVIKDGKAFVEKASCPDGICSDHSPVYRDGESIICLPNKVVITVNADSSADAPDAIA